MWTVLYIFSVTAEHFPTSYRTLLCDCWRQLQLKRRSIVLSQFTEIHLDDLSIRSCRDFLLAGVHWTFGADNLTTRELKFGPIRWRFSTTTVACKDRTSEADSEFVYNFMIKSNREYLVFYLILSIELLVGPGGGAVPSNIALCSKQSIAW